MNVPNLEKLVMMTAEAGRPPERLTVPEAAEKYRILNNPGAYVGPWKNEMVPYMIEPMEHLTSTKFKGLVFCGSSQSSKTELFLNYLLYTVICDPADLMMVGVSQMLSNDFSKRRVDRMHRDSPELGKRLLPIKQYDGIFNKRYLTGAMVNFSWPAATQLRGRPIPRMFLTDYDGMPMDVDGEGSPYDLARARTTTFGRHGMTIAESSPAKPVMEPNWVARTRHEAPPCEGILALYNRGDRRRWYWECVVCKGSFEPSFSLLQWDFNPDLMKAASTTRLPCPHCGAKYRHQETKLPGKFEMNKRGFWLKDGQERNNKGVIKGEAFGSEIASFWLKGVASAFKDWTTIVWNYLVAEQEYSTTGAESALQTTVNTDQSEPYIPKSHISDRVPEKLRDRAFNFGFKVVPPQVTFLVAAIDVQKGRFVVQVTGVSTGGDFWIIDRYDIRYSMREDSDKEGQMLTIRPFTYREDWRILLKEVLLKSYPLGDGSGRHMAVKATICDSGGGDDGTANAYALWRWLKAGPSDKDPDKDDWPDWIPGLHEKFQLYKGESVFTGPRVKITWPDSGRQSKYAGARGEIPVLRCNTTTIKNQLDGMLDRVGKPRSGQVNFPEWLPINFYKELCVETKSPKGLWENPRGHRNESWDLLVMTIAVLLERKHVGIERLDWESPPPWATDWDENRMVFMPDTDEDPFAFERGNKYSLGQLGDLLG